MTSFVLGTRGSTLAIRQTEDIISRLRGAHPAMGFQLERVRTAADTHPDTPLQRLEGIGFFVKELEIALLEGRIDAAVHSMKDLPTIGTPGLEIAGIAQREDPRDVLVGRMSGRNNSTLASLPRGARVGTSSPRRAAFLRAIRSDIQIVPIRGNVETRIRKVDSGELHAVCLAGAGLRRIGLADRVSEWIPLESMLPAPGQGALGVQIRADDERAGSVVRAVDDLVTRLTVEAERAVLRRLQGGCRVPLGAFAEVADQRLRLRAAVVSPDGNTILRSERAGSTAEAESLGQAVGEDLLSKGAAALT